MIKTAKDVKDYFKSFWRVREVVVHENTEPGTVNITVKSSLPLFFWWDLTNFKEAKPIFVRVLIKNDWLLGSRSFDF